MVTEHVLAVTQLKHRTVGVNALYMLNSINELYRRGLGKARQQAVLWFQSLGGIMLWLVLEQIGVLVELRGLDGPAAFLQQRPIESSNCEEHSDRSQRQDGYPVRSHFEPPSPPLLLQSWIPREGQRYGR